LARVLVTGGTGFLGARLVTRLLRTTDDTVTILDQASAMPNFERLTRRLADVPDLDKRLSMLEGDIAQKGLGLDRPADAEVIWNFAAIYRLEVGREIAEKVNVHGTENMLDFAAGCPSLKVFNHVSTCYVSGKRRGRIFEEELDEGQEFNNWYEETKFRSEVLVRKRMKEMPVRTFRPAVVVGDSRTGEAAKYDGIYFFAEVLNRPLFGCKALGTSFPIIPGDGENHVNAVPVDFLIDAMAAIGAKDETIGKTFQLADPAPLTVNGMVETLSNALGVKPSRMHLPYKLCNFAFRYAFAGKLLGLQFSLKPPFVSVHEILKQLIPYCDHRGDYDTSNTAEALEGTGVKCPRFDEYVHVIIGHWLEDTGRQGPGRTTEGSGRT